jgi:hypothetical protein
MKISETELARAKAEIREKALEFSVKVQPIFELNNWKYTCIARGMSTPTVNDIYFHVLSLVASLNLDPNVPMTGISSGRITSRLFKYSEESDIVCTLELVPEWINCYVSTDTNERTNENGR